MTTSTSTSLLDWILTLFKDPDAREAFRADPDKYAAQHGFENVSAADMQDVLCVAADSQPAHSDHGDHGDHSHRSDYSPPPSHHHGEAAPHYLNRYITNNYQTVEKHETNIDQSIHQNVDTHGGDFDQHIDNDPVVASGDGAVATAGDIRDSTVTPGSGNVIGDDNNADTGDGNNTAFGSGDASSTDIEHSSFGDGSSLTGNGTADGNNTSNDTHTVAHNSGSGDTSVSAAGAGGYSDAYADQHQSDNSEHSNYEDASHTDTHDAFNSHNSADLSDSHDYVTH